MWGTRNQSWRKNLHSSEDVQHHHGSGVFAGDAHHQRPEGYVDVVLLDGAYGAIPRDRGVARAGDDDGRGMTERRAEVQVNWNGSGWVNSYWVQICTKK